MLEISYLTKNKPDHPKLEGLCKKILRLFTLKDKNIDIGLIFIGDQKMRNMNKAYRGEDLATDVLSFNAGKINDVGKEIVLGDIFINIAQAKRQAKETDTTISNEITSLFIHGLLHLLGFDHYGKKKTDWDKALNKIRTKIKIELPDLN